MQSIDLKQDPHGLRETREKVLEVAIGREVRAFRRKQEITVAELSDLTGLSIGMLSKIENGNTSLGSSFKCNTQSPLGIGGCDGHTKQAPQQRGTWRDISRA